MVNREMNNKTLRYIMGNSFIGVTLDTYMYIGYKEAGKEMKKASNS